MVDYTSGKEKGRKHFWGSINPNTHHIKEQHKLDLVTEPSVRKQDIPETTVSTKDLRIQRRKQFPKQKFAQHWEG